MCSSRLGSSPVAELNKDLTVSSSNHIIRQKKNFFDVTKHWRAAPHHPLPQRQHSTVALPPILCLADTPSCTLPAATPYNIKSNSHKYKVQGPSPRLQDPTYLGSHLRD